MRPDLVIEDDPEFVERWNTLTERQMWAVRCRAHGLTNGECAEQAGVSPQAIKNQLTDAFRKMGREHRISRIAFLLGRYHAAVGGE
jgi:DNA-binding NarL/FixJ family response regulator